MGLVQWLVDRALTPGEPPRNRTRKTLIAPMYCIVGAVTLFWFMFLLPATFAYTGSDLTSAILIRSANVVITLALLPAGVYVVWTRRVSRLLCEVPVSVASLGVVLYDAGNVISGDPSAISLNVIVLDCLLLCGCSDTTTRGIVAMSVAWIAVRCVLEVEWKECSDTDRFSLPYVLTVLGTFTFRTAVLTVDFLFTRGFAQQMNEQKAMVDASIDVSALAAVHLSRYETEETRVLLEGPGGEGLPPMLRTALLQVVANLALYRPYLPQSCLPGGDREQDDSDTEARSVSPTSNNAGSLVELASSASFVSNVQAVTRPRVQLSMDAPPDEGSCGGDRRLLLGTEVRTRNVSMLAVNVTGFLGCVDGRAQAGSLVVRGEVCKFVGEVTAERGLVDALSGDHMLATFNAARMCTTHRVSAARVAWGMTAEPEVAQSGRRASIFSKLQHTAGVCSGSVLCGDFGTSEVRRFMLVGSTFNTLQCLERVAAQLRTLLIDDNVCCDADVDSNFFTVLVERLCYAKRGPKPFLVWQLAGRRAAGEVDEWMYELERQAPNPHADWNKALRGWLHFGPPVSEDTQSSAPLPVSAGVSAPREQSILTEAAVVGGTVAFRTGTPRSRAE